MSEPVGQTPSQTVGPFFAYGLVPGQYGYPFRSLFGPELAEARTPGLPIEIRGVVLDGDGQPIPDALLEIMHADASGRRPATPAEIAASGFRGFGRMGTGTLPGHEFAFRTVKPGAMGDGAPCVDVILTMRGLLSHAFTRIWFDDETRANAGDPLFVSVPADRRATLLARREPGSGPVLVYRFDIRMQGDAETVFFDR